MLSSYFAQCNLALLTVFLSQFLFSFLCQNISHFARFVLGRVEKLSSDYDDGKNVSAVNFLAHFQAFNFRTHLKFNLVFPFLARKPSESKNTKMFHACFSFPSNHPKKSASRSKAEAIVHLEQI